MEPVSVCEREVNCQISFNWDGDCHQDADGEEDVVERVEEVREEMKVSLNTPVSQPVVCLAQRLVESFPDWLQQTEYQEEHVGDRQSYQQVVEVTFERLLAENQNRREVRKDSKNWENYAEITTWEAMMKLAS